MKEGEFNCFIVEKRLLFNLNGFKIERRSMGYLVGQFMKLIYQPSPISCISRYISFMSLTLVSSNRFRLYSSKLEKGQKDGTGDVFDILEEKVEEEIGYDQWLKNTKEALSKSKGKFWLGKTTPFPYNPTFIPKPVLADSVKIRIFELYKQNSKVNDPRNLAQMFKISIERVQAILRQKELELTLIQSGKVVDSNYVSQMESNLECVTDLNENISPANENMNKHLPFRPMFACVPEGRGFNFEDAKAVLISKGINPKVPNDDSNNSRKEYEIKGKETHEQPSVISKSEFEVSRSKFVFVNVDKHGSKNKTKDTKPSIVVRDRDGSLRGPTSKEFEIAAIKTWNRNQPKSSKILSK